MFAAFFLFIFTILLLYSWLRRPKNLPPGEWGLPIVGYAPFMAWKMSKTMEKLQKKHGNIYKIKIGSRLFVVLSDFHLIKSAFQKPEISGRPDFYHFKAVKKNPHLGVLHSDGHVWTVNRRFALKTLRDFGLGKKSFLDGIILNEAQSLIQAFKQTIAIPIVVDATLNVAVLNVIWRLVANRRYDVSEKEIKRFSKNINDNIVERDGPLSILGLCPWLIPFVPKFIKNKWMKEARIVRRREEVLFLIMGVIKDHKKTFDKKNPRDYIDKYLIELQENDNDPNFQHWGDEDLLQNLYDFFIAGSDTTATVLRWFFLYMAKFPQVQRKVQKEIDDVIPRGQLPSILDKDRLPFLEALTLEINRKVSLVPNSVPHEVTEDTVLEGYNIPKGTIVICDMELCHKNPRFWKYPNDFSLDNFLDNKGKVIPNKEGYLPFSLGRHACLGESLAKMELFVFMGAILQNFEISEPVGQNASLSPNKYVNTFNVPSKFNVILNKR